MRQGVTLELETPRTLRFGTNAMVEAQDLLGRPINQLGADLGLKELRVLVYTGLKWDFKAITLAKAGDIIDEVMDAHGIGYLGEKITEAIDLAFPSDDEKKA